MKKIIYIFSAALLCLVACTRENMPVQKVSYTTVPPKDGDMALVTFSVTVPETMLYATQTRAQHDIGDQPYTIDNGDLYVAVFGGGEDEKTGGILRHFLKPHLKESIVHNDDGTTKQVPVLNGKGEQMKDEEGNLLYRTVKTYSVEYEVLMPLSNEPLVLDFLVGAYDAPDGDPYTLDNPLPSTVTINGKVENATEADLMPLIYSEAGKAAYWQRVRIDGVKPNVVDGQYETSTYIIGYDQNDQPIYSDDEDYVAAPIEKLHDLPLIRNFAKITITSDSDDFDITGFYLIDTPRTGAVVPYSGNDGYRTIYTKINEQTVDADDVMGSYVGYVNSRELNTTTVPAADDFFTPGTEFGYMYERSIPSNNPVFKESGALIEVTWKTGPEAADGMPRYYKISFMNENGYLPILRNIVYNFQVTGIKAPKHHKTPQNAYNGDWLGDISANIATSMLNEIGTQTSKIQVSQTSITSVGAAKPKSFTFAFYPDANGPAVTASSGNVTISITQMEVSGYASAIDQDKDDDGFVDGIKDNGDGTVTVQLLGSEGGEKMSKVRVQGQKAGQRPLYREIIFTVMDKQNFVADGEECSAVHAAGATDTSNQDVVVYLMLPDGLPRDIFPLQIMIEPQNNGLRSVVHGDESSLPVKHGVSAFNEPGSEKLHNYYFVKTIAFDEYAELQENGEYKYKNEYPCYFKTRLSGGNSTAIKINDLNKEFFNEALIQLTF
ncbi:MAG: hypothetical protein IKG84_03280 [Bacteroidales bacterium]|nr:hypothetical protein [Fibrobacter sp.]MBR3387241.1 hypothetical protein [Bacteroidales bacterium]